MKAAFPGEQICLLWKFYINKTTQILLEKKEMLVTKSKKWSVHLLDDWCRERSFRWLTNHLNILSGEGVTTKITASAEMLNAQFNILETTEALKRLKYTLNVVLSTWNLTFSHFLWTLNALAWSYLQFTQKGLKCIQEEHI